MIDELFVTENIEQVYALVILKPFSEKAMRADRNQVKKKFAQANKAVEKFHFPGHVSKKYHETCDPLKMSCFNDINSPIHQFASKRLQSYINLHK